MYTVSPFPAVISHNIRPVTVMVADTVSYYAFCFFRHGFCRLSVPGVASVRRGLIFRLFSSFLFFTCRPFFVALMSAGCLILSRSLFRLHCAFCVANPALTPLPFPRCFLHGEFGDHVVYRKKVFFASVQFAFEQFNFSTTDRT